MFVCSYLKQCWEENYKPSAAKEADGDVTVRNVQRPEDLFYLQMKRAKIDKRDELQIYLEEPVVSADDDLLKDGILNWWKVINYSMEYRKSS